MDLREINEKIKEELGTEKEVEGADYENDMGEESEEEKEKRAGNSKVRVETTQKIKGIIRTLNYEIKYKELAERIKDEVKGVIVTREKAKQIFAVVRDMMGF